MDDLYLAVPHELFDAVWACILGMMAGLDAELRQEKTKVWLPNGDASSMSPEFAGLIVSELPCLGSAVRLRTYADRLEALIDAGLSRHEAFCLLRTFVNGAVTHIQRSMGGGAEVWHPYDAWVVTYVERWIGGQLGPASRNVLFTPLARGGCGFGSDADRADPAVVGSWTLKCHP